MRACRSALRPLRARPRRSRTYGRRAGLGRARRDATAQPPGAAAGLCTAPGPRARHDRLLTKDPLQTACLLLHTGFTLPCASLAAAAQSSGTPRATRPPPVSTRASTSLLGPAVQPRQRITRHHDTSGSRRAGAPGGARGCAAPPSSFSPSPPSLPQRPTTCGAPAGPAPPPALTPGRRWARRRAGLSRASGEANLARCTPEDGASLHRSERLTAWWGSEPRGRLVMCAHAQPCTARWARA